jgi:hypothetical protein
MPLAKTVHAVVLERLAHGDESSKWWKPRYAVVREDLLV